MIAIQIENLSKFYGQVKALEGLNVAVETGSVYGFLGPNGAGKSTTIRLLTGLARPTSGTAQVAEIDIEDRRRLATRIGYLPEEPVFYGWMTPVEFLDHTGRLFGLSGAERKVRCAELIDRVGLRQAAKRRIAGFSRGMRQRLGLAQALINKPEVLLLDEPASALDPAGRKEVLELIKQQSGESTVFMSTHILADVERVCDTVGIINQGKLVVEARQEELLARYSIPGFELECERGYEDKLQGWAKSLPGFDWVRSFSLNGTSLRVVVNDLEMARQSLLPNVMQAGIVLRRYEVVTPSLEDIFLQLVGKEETK